MAEETISQVAAMTSSDGLDDKRIKINHVNYKGRSGKAPVQSRYRGNKVSSTHDLCKLGKRREDDLVIKPLKLVKKKNVENGDLKKAETFDLMKKPLRTKSSTTPSESVLVRKVKKVSRMSESKSSKPVHLKNKEKIKIDEPVRCDKEIHGDDVLLPPAAVSNEINHANLSRFSIGGPSKSPVQSRYRGNQMSLSHDLCQHGQRREDDLVIKPWKLVQKNNVENGDLRKVETLDVIKKSLGNVSTPKKPLQVARREASASDIVKSCDGLSVKKSETKSTATTSDSVAVRKINKTNLDVKKVSRISESSKEDHLKNLKNKEKIKIDEPVRCEDLLGKKVSRINENKSSKEVHLKNLKNKEKVKIDAPVKCESSTREEKKKSIKSEIQQSSEKKISRGIGKKSPKPVPSLIPSPEKVQESRVTRSEPKPIRQITSRPKTGLSEKKEIGSATLVTKSKRIGLKLTSPPPGPPLSFKKGKILEPKLRSGGNNKNMKDVGKISDNNGEGKREKVVLRQRKVETKKKVQTLCNDVIEETVNKLEKVTESKVQALVGAFETVTSLQDDNIKTSQEEEDSEQVLEG